jgi:predicted ATP-grasp superfamily ATP-dependent carboligase
MKKYRTANFVERELGETIRLANSIVEFYEDMLSHHVEKSKLLEAENASLRQLVAQSKDLLVSLYVIQYLELRAVPIKQGFFY